MSFCTQENTVKFRYNERFYIEGPDRNAKARHCHQHSQQGLQGKGQVGSLIGACDGMCDIQSTTHSTVTPLMQIGSIKVMKSVSSSTKLQIQSLIQYSAIFQLVKSRLRKTGLASTSTVLKVIFFSPALMSHVLQRAPTVCRRAPHSSCISLL